MTAAACGRCGHGIEHHGARGAGACSIGRASRLEQATAACVAATLAGETFDAGAFVAVDPCRCLRFRVRAVAEAAPELAAARKDGEP